MLFWIEADSKTKRIMENKYAIRMSFMLDAFFRFLYLALKYCVCGNIVVLFLW